MPGAGSATYIVAAASSTNVPTTSGTPNGDFNPGALPLPVVDNVSLAVGQYFLLTAQNNITQNGVWYCDGNGPVPVTTVGGGLDVNVQVLVGPGYANLSQNANTTWIYTATYRGNANTPGF